MNKILEFLSFNIEYNDTSSYKRVILVSSILILTIFVFIFFAIFNAFFLEQYIISILDIGAASLSIFALYHLQKYKNLKLAAKLATLNLMLFFLLLAYVNGNSHFTLIWTIFLPIFAFLTNGKNIGLYFSLIFYSILFTISYTGIEVWNNGQWLIQDWLRLVFASSILTFIMYMNESALEESKKKLMQIRRKEKIYIKKLHNLSIIDQLTGLFNRRYYNDMIPKFMSLAKRKKLYVTFFILDLDYFKNYNDHYGHIKGDEALIKVSHALKNHIQRNDDFVFRLGGEEFAGIILSDNKENTHEWILSTCQIIENLKIDHAQSKASQYLTASIGISTIDYEQNYTMDDLYHFADEALYIAKNEGRNKSSINIQCA